MRTANLAAVLVFGTFSAMFFFVSVFLQQADRYAPTRAGFAYAPLAVCVAAGAAIASGLVTRMAARPVLIAGLVVTVAGLLGLWRAPATGGYAAGLLPLFLALGLGCGMVYVTLQIAAFVGVSDQDAGMGAGLINTSQAAGGALGLAVIATIAYSGITARLAAAGTDPGRIQDAQASANHRAFLATACAGIAALLVAALLMPRSKASTSPQRESEGLSATQA